MQFSHGWTRVMSKACSIPECQEQVFGHGFCSKHYQRWRRCGDPLIANAARARTQTTVVAGMRTCPQCGFVGGVALFRAASNICKKCNNARCRQWELDNLKKVQAINDRKAANRAFREFRRRAMKAGEDLAVIEQYYKTHSSQCAICGQPPGRRALAYDHDHVTGKFRGLLCDNCNNGLGRFKDDIGNLEAAIGYLKRAGAEPGTLFAAPADANGRSLLSPPEDGQRAS